MNSQSSGPAASRNPAHTFRPARVLVLTVGTGRNRQDIADALCFSIQRNNADAAVFLCSAQTARQTLPLITSRLRDLGWAEHRWRTDTCQWPDPGHTSPCPPEEHIEALYRWWLRRWPQLLADWEGADVIVDFTSGTKAMSAAAPLVGLRNGVAALSYVVGPRDPGGRVTRSENVITFRPSIIYAHRDLARALDYFHAGDYAAARDLAKGCDHDDWAPAEPDLREYARCLHRLADLMDHWDRFDYKQAAHLARQTQRYWPQWQRWLDPPGWLETAHEIIKHVRDSIHREEPRYTPQLLADLIGNARRCLHRKKWDDAVVRLYRACEMIGQYYLQTHHDLNTSDLDVPGLPEHLRPKYEPRRRRGKVTLGLEETFHLIEELDPQSNLTSEFRERFGDVRTDKRGKLFSLLQQRNNSILGHGLYPIKPERSLELYEQVKALARAADPDIIDTWLPRTSPPHIAPLESAPAAPPH